MIFSFVDFLRNILSYEAIITGKCVGHKYDSDKKKYSTEKKRKLKNYENNKIGEKNFPTRREIP